MGLSGSQQFWWAQKLGNQDFSWLESSFWMGAWIKGVPGAVGLLSIFFSHLPCSEFDLRRPRDASKRGLWGQGGERMENFLLSWFIFLLRCL